jgi:hypothetical protein
MKTTYNESFFLKRSKQEQEQIKQQVLSKDSVNDTLNHSNCNTTA